MNDIQKVLMICSMFCVLSMHSQEDKPSDKINLSVPAGSLSFLGNLISGGKQAVYKASEHREWILVGSIWFLRYGLYEREHRGKKEVPQINNTVNVTVTVANNVTSDIDALLEVMNKKQKKQQPIMVYDHSPEHRYYLHLAGEGLDTSIGGRALSLNDRIAPYMGISRKQDILDKKVGTPYVRFFEVAGTYVDMHDFSDYANDKIDLDVANEYKNSINPVVRASLRRIIAGYSAIHLTSIKHTAMEPEEILTYRALDVGARVAKEYLKPEEDSLVNDALDSVQEAAQRRPYYRVARHNTGHKSVVVHGNEDVGTLTHVTNAAGDVLINAGARFAVKQVPKVLNTTETGQGITLWTNENVPEGVQDIAKEVASAGLTYGAYTVVKSSGVCSLQ